MAVLANPAEIDSAESAPAYLYRPDTLLRRIEKVRAGMEEKGIDAMLVSHPDNRRYLSGFSGHDAPPLDSAGFLLIGPDDICLITDGRYDIQAARELSPELGISVVVRSGKVPPAIAEQIAKRNCKRVGFETAHLIHTWWHDLEQALPDARLIAVEKLVEPLRGVKDEDEMRIIRRAIEISDQAFNIVSRRIKPGMTEKQVASDIEKTMQELGADERAFGTIVAAGPNGAMAHAVPGDRPIQEGEPIVIDMGAKLEGYHSDMTRTICLGEPPDRFREIYNIVLEANLAAERKLKAGVTGIEGDRYSREVIEAAGYGDKFSHSLGHGIGLQVHEPPNLSKIAEDPIPENAVTSVEPGIYIEGWGGVRVEDLVLFHTDGVEVLTKADKQGRFE
ncbi:MAG TPA: Xaa-Pro peptidase family protein [Chloroflexia bacterium]|nr:Xaa-Pro peptidase family protein [Chloroflexia bacterium]